MTVIRARSASISIHALREEGDAPNSTPSTLRTVFLSTPSARRATDPDRRTHTRPCYFYPRPPRGGRLKEFAQKDYRCNISIHALREEGDANIPTNTA